jgi:hypothetical protein
LKSVECIEVEFFDGLPAFGIDSFRRIPLFSHIDEDIVNFLSKKFQLEHVYLGGSLIIEGKDRQKFSL